MDPFLGLAGLAVGFVVGLTGMGGGALLTPVLVLGFGVPPLAAVSSDLVTSLLMKPVGAVVHARRGTVDKGLVLWLCVGSVPAAFSGVFVVRLLGTDEAAQERLKVVLGAILLLAAVTMVVKAAMALRQQAADRRQGIEASQVQVGPVQVRRVPTVVVGALGGLAVGMTSVGSGSLIIVALLMLYPALRSQHLVGTDLVQAVPLVAAASLGHLLFGDFRLDVTASLLLGAIPGVYLGARVSSAAPGGLVRRALVLVLVASGLKLVGLPSETVAWLLLGALVLGPAVWAVVRNTSGFEGPLHKVPDAGPARLVVRAATGSPGSRQPARPAPATDDDRGRPR